MTSQSVRYLALLAPFLLLALSFSFTNVAAVDKCTIGFELESFQFIYILKKNGNLTLDTYKGYVPSENGGVSERKWVAETLAASSDLITWKVGADSLSGYNDVEVRTSPMSLNDYHTKKNTHPTIIKDAVDFFTKIYTEREKDLDAQKKKVILTRATVAKPEVSHEVVPLITTGGDAGAYDKFNLYGLRSQKGRPLLISPQVTFSMKLAKVVTFFGKIRTNDFKWAVASVAATKLNTNIGLISTETPAFQGLAALLVLYTNDLIASVPDDATDNSAKKDKHSMYLRGDLNKVYKSLPGGRNATADKIVLKNLLDAAFTVETTGKPKRSLFIQQMVEYTVSATTVFAEDKLPGHISRDTGEDTIDAQVVTEPTIFLEIRSLRYYMEEVSHQERNAANIATLLQEIVDWFDGFWNDNSGFAFREVTQNRAWARKFGRE